MSENMQDRRDERLDVLKQLPPLMPRFLKRRRSVLPELGEAIGQLCARLDVDRPAFFTLRDLHELQGAYGWQPVTESQIRARDPYSTIDRMAAPVALFRQKGLLVAGEDGRLSLLPQARVTIDELHTKAREYLGRLEPLPPTELQELARQLERAVGGILADPVLAPRPGSHLAGSRSVATFGKDAPPMVRLEQAIFDLWMARSDAHIRAWQNADMDGPTVEVLTVLWLGEYSMVAELKEALKGTHTPESIDASLGYLADNDYAIRGIDDMVELTAAGVLVRQDIERETDRIYFGPWPHTYKEALWVCDALARLVDYLEAQ